MSIMYSQYICTEFERSFAPLAIVFFFKLSIIDDDVEPETEVNIITNLYKFGDVYR